jgi:hypothetical protein
MWISWQSELEREILNKRTDIPTCKLLKPLQKLMMEGQQS